MEFHHNGRLPRGTNFAFITLIPKKQDPQRLEDYRPISLVGCMYKILAKVLANRVKQVLPSVIDEKQSAFLEGRNMLNSVLVVNKVIDEARRMKKPIIFFKVDFEKAYDSVSWEYLLYMLQRLGFNPKWIGWIRECLNTACLSVLVNDSPIDEFPMRRGLRQGDPLAPFLFTIVVEGLSGLMREAEKHKRFNSVKVGHSQVEVSLVQYADDTMIFGEASLQNVFLIIIRCFEVVSGLKVNFFKSKFGSICVDQALVEDFAHLLNCTLLSLPFPYLGLPIGENPRNVATWRPIITKVQKKLAMWKHKVLSMAGRVCLVNSVLTSLPLYYLSFFKIPHRVAKEIVSLHRRFLWGGVGDQKKVCWISWDKVTLPKGKGGLGVKNIILFNKSLLAKWRWNLFHQSSSMWAQVLQSRYKGGHNLCAQASSQKDSIWWRDLLKECGGVEEDNWFDKLIEWRVGVGSKVRFWLDKWVGPTNLAVAFPRLFIISDQQLASIAEMGAIVNGEWVWHLRWRRHRFEWEISLEQQFLHQISSHIFNSSQCDSWNWVAESSGMFSVKSAYQTILAESITTEDHDIFKIIWSIPAPPKVLFFAWRLLNRGLPTVDNLARWNILIGEHETRCIFCKVDIETTTHIFCTCLLIDRVWKHFIFWLNCPAPLPRQINEHFSFLPAPIQNKSEAETWHTVWLATMWTLWRYRNKCIFDGETFEQGTIVRDILIFSWRWLSTLKPSFAYSFSQWSSNPGPCICFGCG